MQGNTNDHGFTIADATSMGAVHLRIASLDRSLAFYRDMLGYQVAQPEAGTARLAPNKQEPANIVLHEQPGVDPVPRRATGLFHLAILLPDRLNLARVTRHLAGHSYHFGASDHGVSEALYLDDPDGNGLEIYVDRPRTEWPYQNGELGMGTWPLDFESLLGELRDDPAGWQGIPSGTGIGHVHLKVSDLGRAEQYYVDRLGFSPTVRGYPGALFVSAGGYHHHLGLNTWSSRGASPAGPDYAGLLWYTILLPDRRSLDAVVERLEAGGMSIEPGPDDAGDGAVSASDMDGNQVVVACRADRPVSS